MPASSYHLAEFNISRLIAPLESPDLKEFVDFLEPVNRFAEESKGFVWRLTAADGQASSYLPPAFDDPLIVTNLTVWADLESLKQFTYQTVHTYFLRSRKKWFVPTTEHQMVLWWVEQGQLPTLEDAKEKLNLLKECGPCHQAFTFQSVFDPQGKPLPSAVQLHQ